MYSRLSTGSLQVAVATAKDNLVGCATGDRSTGEQTEDAGRTSLRQFRLFFTACVAWRETTAWLFRTLRCLTIRVFRRKVRVVDTNRGLLWSYLSDTSFFSGYGLSLVGKVNLSANSVLYSIGKAVILVDTALAVLSGNASSGRLTIKGKVYIFKGNFWALVVYNGKAEAAVSVVAGGCDKVLTYVEYFLNLNFDASLTSSAFNYLLVTTRKVNIYLNRYIGGLSEGAFWGSFGRVGFGAPQLTIYVIFNFGNLSQAELTYVSSKGEGVLFAGNCSLLQGVTSSTRLNLLTLSKRVTTRFHNSELYSTVFIEQDHYVQFGTVRSKGNTWMAVIESFTAKGDRLTLSVA